MGWPTRITTGVLVVAGLGLLGAPGPVRAGQRRPEILQIIAHPDDDLLFMSPDLPRDIGGGAGVTTVVLTAGEGHAGLRDRHDPLAYAAQRRAGLRAAYAAMAGVPDRWRTETARAGRARYELDTLAPRPDIRLAFLMLPDGRDRRAAVGRRALARLYADHGDGTCARTVTPARSPYAFCYTRRDVLAVLADLLRRTHPTVVRAQDPAPDQRYAHDHTDHVAAARFTAEAVRAYGRPLIQVGYRDYNTADSPVNLGGTPLTAKRGYFAAYRAHDYRIRPGARNFGNWQTRMRYRWPRGASWAGRGPDGRLRAYAVLSGGLYVWWQAGSGWAGPAALGGTSLAPALAVAGDEVLALKGHQVVAARPVRSGGRWSATWTTLGGTAYGAPVATTGAGGMTAVFVRDAAGGVAVRCRSASGAWAPGWHALRTTTARRAEKRATKSTAGIRAPGWLRRHARPPGRDVQDGMTAVGGPGGADVLAPTRGGVLSWRQAAGCAFTYAGQVPGVDPGGPILATRDATGNLRLLYEPADSTTVRQVVRTGLRWGTPETPAGAVLHETGEPPVPAGASAPPPGLPAAPIGVPAVATDGAGRTFAVALGSDGHLYASARADGRYGAWRPAA